MSIRFIPADHTRRFGDAILVNRARQKMLKFRRRKDGTWTIYDGRKIIRAGFATVVDAVAFVFDFDGGKQVHRVPAKHMGKYRERSTSVAEQTNTPPPINGALVADKMPNRPSLLKLFNEQYVEYVRADTKNRRWKPVMWPHQATHHLVATSENEDGTNPHVPNWYALSVVAHPMQMRKRRINSQLVQKIRRCLPRKRSHYSTTATVKGKRAVLLELVNTLKAKPRYKLRTSIRRMNGKQCDDCYRTLVKLSLERKRELKQAREERKTE